MFDPTFWLNVAVLSDRDIANVSNVIFFSPSHFFNIHVRSLVLTYTLNFFSYNVNFLLVHVFVLIFSCYFK